MSSTFQATTAIRATGAALLSMLVLLSIILIAESYGSDRSKGAVAAHRAAHVVATQFSWMFEASAHTLQRIEDAAILTPPAAEAPRPILNLHDAVRDLPNGLYYAVYDARGDILYSSLAAPQHINVSGRAYFATARAGTELHIAPMLTDQQNGAQAFIIARRLDVAGRFGGVATIAVPVSTLATLAQTLGLDERSTVSLVASDGMLIARNPPIPPMDLSQSALFKELAKAPDGFYETVSPADGVERIVGYWQLKGWPVIAIAGLDRSGAMAEFWRSMGTATILALPILFGMVWLVHDLIRLLRRDEDRQRALTIANERAGFLLREIHHRVKNNLQTVSSLIRLERLPEATKAGLLGRLNAMVAVHEAMYRSDQFEEICVAPYLERLIENVAKSHGYGVTVRMNIAPVRLTGDRAMQLGLLANELVSNAFKHAFTPRRGGLLEVSVQPVSEPGATSVMLRLVVADDGPGYDPAKAPPQMGSRLIAAFTSQLGGTLSIDSAGPTQVTVEFPKDYLAEGMAEGETPQPRSAQDRSTAGARSIAAIRLSNPLRSSKRT